MASIVERGIETGELELSSVPRTDIQVKNAAVGDAKQRQMEQFRLEGNSQTPLTTYWGAKISVSGHSPSGYPK